MFNFSTYKNSLTFKVRKNKRGLCATCQKPVVVIKHIQDGVVREERKASYCYDHLLYIRENHRRKINGKSLHEKKVIQQKKAAQLENVKLPRMRNQNGTYAKIY